MCGRIVKLIPNPKLPKKTYAVIFEGLWYTNIGIDWVSVRWKRQMKF